TINVEDINTAAFSSKLNEIRNLTTQFKEMVQNQLTVEERNEIRNRVKNATNNEIKEMTQSENRIRKMHNEKAMNSFLARINTETAAMHQNGYKLMNLSQRFTEIHQLKTQYLNQNITKENINQLKLEWKEMNQAFSSDKSEVVAKNERAILYQKAAEIKSAMQNASDSGKDISALESQLQTALNQAKEIRGTLTTAQIREQVQKSNQTLTAVENHETIRERLKIAVSTKASGGGNND
ncbi:MAG: hypothetical protein ABIA21_01745, partial [Candidatus Aenigmatarchaeota archaeon]